MVGGGEVADGERPWLFWDCVLLGETLAECPLGVLGKNKLGERRMGDG